MAMFIAMKIDEAHGNTLTSAQELVIDIFNHVNEEVFKELSEENKILHLDIENKLDYIKQLERTLENKLLKNELMPRGLIKIAKEDKKVNHYNKELDVTFTILNGYRL